MKFYIALILIVVLTFGCVSQKLPIPTVDLNKHEQLEYKNTKSTKVNLTNLEIDNEIIVPEPPGYISPIKSGAVAPYSGVLFSIDAAAWIIAYKESIDKRILIEVNNNVKKLTAKYKKEINDLAIRAKADKAIINAQLSSKDKIIETYRLQIKDFEKNNNSLTSNPIFWSGLGATGGVIITLCLVFIINSASR